MKRFSMKKILTVVSSFVMFSALTLAVGFIHPITANADAPTTFEMREGASVRKDGSPYGIRFTTQISQAEYDAIIAADANATFGMLIIPNNILQGNELTLSTANAKNLIAEKWNDALADETDGVDRKAYTGVIVGSETEDFPEIQYGREMAARAYVTYNGTTYYTDTEVRSIAYVASAAVAKGESSDYLNEICESIVPATDLSFAESAISIGLGEIETPVLNGTHGLVVKLASSDTSVVTIDENGKIFGKANGTATITATVGNITAETVVTVSSAGSYNAQLGNNGTNEVLLPGTNRENLPYIALADCEVGDCIEAEFTGMNMPIMRFMAEELSGNSKSGVGFHINNDSGAGLRIYPKNFAQGGATVLSASYGNKTLDANTTYVIRAWLTKNTSSVYVMNVYLYTKAEDGTLTMLALDKHVSSDSADWGFTEGNDHYIILMGNAYSTGNTVFKYQRYKNYTSNMTETADGSITLNGTARATMPYVAMEQEVGDYLEVAFTGTYAPTLRLMADTVSSASTSGNGFTISNDIGNNGMSIYTGANNASTKNFFGGSVANRNMYYYSDTTAANWSSANNYVIRTGVELENGKYVARGWLYWDNNGELILLASQSIDSSTTVTNGVKHYAMIMNNAAKNQVPFTYRMMEKTEVEDLIYDPNTSAVYWAADKSASGYQISVNGGAWTDVSSDSYMYSYSLQDALTEGAHKIAVRAKTQDIYNIYSERSIVSMDPVDESALDCSIVGNTISWTARTDAIGYQVKLNDGAWIDVDGTSYAVSSTEYEEGQVVTVAVRAKFTYDRYSESSTQALTYNASKATFNADGTVTLAKAGRADQSYVALNGCGENDWIEVAFTGKNFPTLRFMAETVNGDTQTAGVGFILNNDISGLRVYYQYTNYGNATTLTSDSSYGYSTTNNPLEDGVDYVIRAGVTKDTSGNWQLNVYLYTQNENGTLSLMTMRRYTSDPNIATGITDDVVHYIMLLGNAQAGSAGTTVRYRRYTASSITHNQYVDGDMYISGGATRTALPYVAFEDGESIEWIDVRFEGNNFPVIRFMASALDGNSKSGDGLMISVAEGNGLCVYDGNATSNRLALADGAYKTADLDTTASYRLVAGLKQNDAGQYYLEVYFFQKEANGLWTQLNTVTQSNALSFDTSVPRYLILLSNAQRGSATAFQINVNASEPEETANAQFELYGYTGPSDGTYTIDGVKYDSGVNSQTAEGYATYADAGMNVLLLQGDDAWNDTAANQERVLEIMDMAYAEGLKVIVHDSRIYNYSNRTVSVVGVQHSSFEGLVNQIRTWMEPYMDHPAFYGLQLKDEPTYAYMEAIGDVYKAIKTVAPDCYVQCNLYPLNEWVKTNYVATPTDDIYADYKSYLGAFLDNTGADYILFDSYPMEHTYIASYHLRGLQIAAELCNERDVELYSVAQAGSWNYGETLNRRACTEADMRWQTNVLMGMGVKQIAYFTYQTKKASSTSGEYFIDGASMVKYDGTTTELYTAVQTIHSEMQMLAPIILGFDYVGAKTYENYVYSVAFSQNEFNTHMSYLDNVTQAENFTSITGVSLSGTTALMIIEMVNADGIKGYMIINISNPGLMDETGGTTTAVDMTTTANITFDATNLSVWTNGVHSTASATDYSVTLEAGSAVFVIPY